MGTIEIKIPAMGEGIIDATIIKWHIKTGDAVKQDDVLCDIATDKVDSEITSPETGVVDNLLFKESDVVSVGKTIATLKTTGENVDQILKTTSEMPVFKTVAIPKTETKSEEVKNEKQESKSFVYLSPLVKKMIQEYNLNESEIEKIKGSGMDGRITKEDVLPFTQNQQSSSKKEKEEATVYQQSIPIVKNDGDTIIEMDRVRMLISEHMIHSKHTSAHVTSFVEADVTNLVMWRNSTKEMFEKDNGVKLTYLPIFVQAVVSALHEFPMLNASLQEHQIIIHKQINIGIATALPNNNLMVPVVKNADRFNLLGLIKIMNDMANRARKNQLQPSEIMGGTFSVTNLGTFGTLAGTPVINQPQVAILGIGAIRKMPAVIETQQGDAIAIRNKVILSLAFDHRIVDGMMAGKFLNVVVSYLENFK
jgi:2-oxoglutarate dehydrogenase E2 component (dihydrolipoamide succinyltransferase)